MNTEVHNETEIISVYVVSEDPQLCLNANYSVIANLASGGCIFYFGVCIFKNRVCIFQEGVCKFGEGFANIEGGLQMCCHEFFLGYLQ